jgi:hypothetical protein
MKHTPGPWKRGSRILDIVGGKPTTLIATIACPSEHPATEAKAHANSNLISAAPEMLEAIELIHGYAVAAMMSNTLGRANKLEQIRVLSAAIISKVEYR